MKIPRDLSGDELAKKLKDFGYEVTRQTGSHMRLTSKIKGKEHNVTMPRHRNLKIGTISGILSDIADYLEIKKEELVRRLFL